MDSIVTIPKAPDVSIVFEVRASTGRKHIQRAAGSFRAMYLDGTVTEKQLVIAPGQTVTLDQGWRAGLVCTNSPLTFTGTGAAGVTAIKVSSILIIDDSFDTVTLAVDSAGVEAIVNLVMKSVPLPPA